jgi:hypothetical protein
MNRLAFATLAGILFVSACASLPGAQADPKAAAATFVQQTMEALPTLTLPATVKSVVQPTATLTRTPTRTPTVTTTAPTSSPTVTGTLPGTVTGTITPNGTETMTATFTMTVTGTLPTPGRVTATATDLMAPRYYGTQPPYVHFGKVKLVNQSKAQVYVSFQCTTPEGYSVIEEYPVGRTFNVSVPAGRCIYVAWVGGRKFEGSFGLGRFEELIMTFKKTSVTIR